MLELAGRLGSNALATGHYARVRDGDLPIGDRQDGGAPDSSEWDAGAAAAPGDGPLLRTAADEGKDQSYVLAALAPQSLARLRFPLGELRKAQVRELAGHAGLAVARRGDSQDLCFLAGTRQASFLERHGGLGARMGSIVDRTGAVLGEHRGAYAFTVGQRHGLGIGGGAPLYVLATDAGANTVTVGPRGDLLAPAVEVRDVTLLRDGTFVDRVRVRSHGRRFACRLAPDAGAGRHPRLRVELEEPAERTAPGQLACLYAGELVVGHGTIAA
jgi:tRNA-specific 2-thiouridylase